MPTCCCATFTSKCFIPAAAAAHPDCHHVGCHHVGCVWPQVKAFIDLVGSLLSASMPPPTGPRGMRPAAQPLATEIVRTMQDTGIVKPLINALKLVDTNHPQVNAPLQLAPDPDSQVSSQTDFLTASCSCSTSSFMALCKILDP